MADQEKDSEEEKEEDQTGRGFFPETQIRFDGLIPKHCLPMK
jgi:hypothetical protein